MSLSTLDLNLLLVLDTVLRERSVAQAARRLHVTPSAISNALAKLRAALGDPLLTRRGRGIVPTPRAEELAPTLARALAELERVVRPTPFDAVTCSRTFTLAMADAGQVASLPAIAVALTKAMPNARLRVVGIDSLLALGDLSSNEVDLHFGIRATGPGIHAEALYDEPTLLVARAAHPAGRAKLSRRTARFAVPCGRGARPRPRLSRPLRGELRAGADPAPSRAERADVRGRRGGRGGHGARDHTAELAVRGRGSCLWSSRAAWSDPGAHGEHGPVLARTNPRGPGRRGVSRIGARRPGRCPAYRNGQATPLSRAFVSGC